MKKLVKAIIFDWDNTIIHMPTEILVKHTLNNNYIGLDTDSFAKYKSMIGKSGILKHYSLDETSFKEFRTDDQKQYFINDLVELIKTSKNNEWKALYFDKFIEMLSSSEDAENVYILSARAHNVDEFMDGLRVLQQYLLKVKNKRIYLPRKEHCFFVGNEPNIAHAKSEVLKKIILKESKENTDILEFADDDHDNVDKAVKALSMFVKPFSWMSVKITHVLKTTAKTIRIS